MEKHMGRRDVLAVGLGILGLFMSAATSSAQTSPITQGSITIGLNRVLTLPAASGTPQDVAQPPDGSGRLFVVGRSGQIRVFSNGSLLATPFLDLNSAATGVNLYTGGEGGLLSMALSPNYATPAGTPGSGKFYTFNTEPVGSGTPDFTHPEIAAGGNNQIVIREWSVNPANPNAANSTSRVLMRINHPQSNHQGGGLKFGPDGNLYVSLGDGGGGNDFSGSFNNPNDGHTNTTGNGQDTSVVFGKLLRIDPLGNNSANGQYGIPAGNPFAASTTARKEVYAYGLRNPFRFSFDRGTGRLYIGDVGQDAREEVDTLPAPSAVLPGDTNFGWPYREGTLTNPNYSAPTAFTSIAPIGEYTHGDGDAILGGFVYRGSAISELVGKYVFGDLDGTNRIGRLFYMDAGGGVIHEFRYSGALTPNAELFGFGEAQNGELYALFANGDVLRIVPEPSLIAPTLLIIAACAGRRRRRAPRVHFTSKSLIV